MGAVAFILNKDTGHLESGESKKCELCNGKIVSGPERHRRRRQLQDSKNWSRLRPMCAKCDGHGVVIQSGNFWRRMYKPAEESYRVGELPATQSIAGTSKAMQLAKKATEGYQEPKKLKAFLTDEMRKANVQYMEVLDMVRKAMVFRAIEAYPHNVTRAAESIGMDRTTFIKNMKELSSGNEDAQ